jgi:hypothetical protein
MVWKIVVVVTSTVFKDRFEARWLNAEGHVVEVGLGRIEAEARDDLRNITRSIRREAAINGSSNPKRKATRSNKRQPAFCFSV